MKQENPRNHLFYLGAVATILALAGILADVIIGTITGGNLAALPQTAIGRFIQFHESPLLGLYNLDLLNIMVQMIMIISYIALYAANRDQMPYSSLMAFVVFLFGSAIMVANNTALPMLELSHKYFATDNETQRMLYAAAGEGMLAQGAHGSPGIFIGFFLPNVAGLLMSVVMLKGGIFTKLNAWLGIIGSTFMLLYVALVNFMPGVETAATAFAMPGGLLLMAWMVLFTIRLWKIGTLPE